MNTTQTNTSRTIPTNSQITNWFESVSAMMTADKFNLQNNIAPSDTAKIYHPAILGNTDEVFKQIREVTGGYFVRKIVIDFVAVILKSESFPLKLAFASSDSKVFIWAEIKENDEVAEDAIIMAEAALNAEYYNLGYNVSATIIEDCDRLAIPTHYIHIPIQELIENGGKI